jgi:NNP family nitrate/nitrite transporter-like MFS transporter
MENRTSFRAALGPVLLLTGIFFMNFTARVIMAPLMPTIEKDLGIGHSQAGSLFLVTSAGYFLSLLCAGFLSSRLTHRRTIVLSATTVGLALVGISFSNSLASMRVGLFALGIAAGAYLPSGIATLTAMVRSRDWGKGIAVHELAPNLGFVAAPLISEVLMEWSSWRGILAFLGGVSIIVGLAFSRLGKGGTFHGVAPSYSSFKTFLKMPAFWIMAVLFSLGIGSSLGIYTMLPLYLVTERGMERNWANILVSISRLSGLAMAILAGWTADRFGSKRTMGWGLLVTGFLTVLLGLSPAHWIIVPIFLQPMIAVCFFPPAFATLSSIGPSSARNVIISLTIPIAFLVGGGAIPAIIGLMADAGSFSLGIASVGVFISSGFALSYYSRLPDNRTG